MRARTALAMAAAGLATIILWPVATVANAASSTYAVRYQFDGGAKNLNTGVGAGPTLVSKSKQGGTIRTVSHGSGEALRFPDRCANPGAAACPRAVVETTGSVSALNPGTRPLSYGATVRLRSDQTSDGENIVQKGYASGEGQYKLQVDGTAGRPSCAIVGVSSAKIYLAKSSVAIDDGAWHTVSCVRVGATLSLFVDGTRRADIHVPASLSIANSDELRIGGKGTSANNDQFNGDLDDVWVTVGP